MWPAGTLTVDGTIFNPSNRTRVWGSGDDLPRAIAPPTVVAPAPLVSGQHGPDEQASAEYSMPSAAGLNTSADQPSSTAVLGDEAASNISIHSGTSSSFSQRHSGNAVAVQCMEVDNVASGLPSGRGLLEDAAAGSGTHLTPHKHRMLLNLGSLYRRSNSRQHQPHRLSSAVTMHSSRTGDSASSLVGSSSAVFRQSTTTTDMSSLPAAAMLADELIQQHNILHERLRLLSYMAQVLTLHPQCLVISVTDA